MLERGVELGKLHLSEDDPDVLRTAFELGVLLQRCDDPAGARRVLEEAYAAGLWRLGDADPLMVEISAGIGAAAGELGNRHEARKAFGRVAQHGPAALGVDHWAVTQARAYLGQDQEPSPVRPQAAPQTQTHQWQPSTTVPLTQPHLAAPQAPPPEARPFARPAMGWMAQEQAPLVEQQVPQESAGLIGRQVAQESAELFGPQVPQESVRPGGRGEPQGPSQLVGREVSQEEAQPVGREVPEESGRVEPDTSTSVRPVGDPSLPVGGGAEAFEVRASQRAADTPADVLAQQVTLQLPTVTPAVAEERVYGAQPVPGQAAHGQAARGRTGEPGAGEVSPRVIHLEVTRRQPRTEAEPTPYEGDALNGPTAPLQVIASRPSTVAPPSEENLTVWTPPERVAAAHPGLEEDTAAQPIIVASRDGNRDAATVQLPVVADDRSATPVVSRGAGRRLKPYGKWVALAVVAALVALVLGLALRGGDAKENVPTLGGPAPSDVRLEDAGTEIGISWHDPADGTVSFMVTMARAGEALKPMATLGPGQTSYALGGLNATLNYCLTVVAVYRDNQFATSPQVCTSRTPATPR